MPRLYFEQRAKLRDQIWSKTKKEPTERQMEELWETLVRVGTDIDEAILSSAGKVIFGDHKALAHVDAKALNAIMPQLRESRRRAMEVWRPEWFRRIEGTSSGEAV